jgi:hypothetical protein
MRGAKAEVWNEREESRCREATVLAKDHWKGGLERDKPSASAGAASFALVLCRCSWVLGGSLHDVFREFPALHLQARRIPLAGDLKAEEIVWKLEKSPAVWKKSG